MLFFSAGCLQLHVLEKYLKSIYNSLRGEKKDFWFKFFWEPENRIACLALGCDLSIFFLEVIMEKSHQENLLLLLPAYGAVC